jgi:hypothetical protein
MTEQQYCADKLLLVTEMLQAAGEYLNSARATCREEDRTMMRLAYDHVLNLRDQIRSLDKKVNELEGDLRIKLGGTPAGASRKSKAARTGALPR